MSRKIALGLLFATVIAAPAIAAPARDPAAALRSMEQVSRLAPDDGGVAIELAAAYQRAGRTADANTAFRRVLTLDNAMLETPTGDAVWSHQIAKQALARTVVLSAR